MAPLDTTHWALFLTVLLISCVFDALTRKVPNWLTVGIVCAGLGARLMVAGIPAAGWGALGALTGLGALLYPFHRGLVAGGDVKLLGAMGGWLGPVATLEALLFGSVAGGLLSMFYLWRAPADQRQEILTNLRLTLYLRAMPEVAPRPRYQSPPYAIALSAGAVASLLLNRVPFGLN